MVGCVLMASGSGERFGANKLLTAVGGVPLYRRALAALSPARLGRRVVCSPYPEILAAGAEYGFLPLPNPDAAEGVSASIRLGLAHMGGMDGALFAVCDQPFLTTESVNRLIDAFEETADAVCTLSWQGVRGNPVIFPAALFEELVDLTGDTGGSAVLRRHPGLLRLVEARSPAELADVDTPADVPAATGG